MEEKEAKNRSFMGINVGRDVVVVLARNVLNMKFKSHPLSCSLYGEKCARECGIESHGGG